MKNDTIILTIFLIILICSFYFNIKEGYATPLPISFVGDGDNQTIIIPRNIDTENGNLKITTPTLIGDITINGDKTVNNLSMIKDANVTGLTTLNVANFNGAINLNEASVNGKTTLRNVDVNGIFNVNNLFTPKNILVGNTITIVGLQSGINNISGHNFFVKFPVEFTEGQVIVVTTPSGTDGWQWNSMTNVLSANKTGFYVTITGISSGGTWEPINVNIHWIACCIVMTPSQQAEQNNINERARIIGNQIQARIEEEERKRREEEERKKRELAEQIRREAERIANEISNAARNVGNTIRGWFR